MYGADGQGPFVSERERERGEAGKARPNWAGSRGMEGGRRRRAGLRLRAERRVRRRMSP